MSLDLCTTCHFGRLMLWSSQGADRMCWHMPWDICRQCSGLGVVATLILHPLCALVHFQQAGWFIPGVGWSIRHFPWNLETWVQILTLNLTSNLAL